MSGRNGLGRRLIGLAGAVAALAGGAATFGQLGPTWLTEYDGPLSQSDVLGGAATAPNGDIVFSAKIRIDTGGGPGDAMLTARLDSNGHFKWAKTWDFAGQGISARDVATDSQGAVYTCGTFYTVFPNFVVLKHDAAGELLWVRQYFGGTFASRAEAMAIDADDNVYIAGSTGQNGSPPNMMLRKYAPDGTLIWDERTTSGLPIGRYIALDPDGNIIVGGAQTGPTIVLWKFTPAGTMLWQRTTAGAIRDLAVGPDGGTVVVGSDATGDESKAVKFDASGTVVWTYTYSTRDLVADRFVAVAIDPANSDAYFVGDGWAQVSETGDDIVTVKMAAGGTVLWSKEYTGPGEGVTGDEVYDIALDSNRNVFVSGKSEQGTAAPAGDGVEGPLVLAYSQTGDLRWQYFEPIAGAIQTLCPVGHDRIVGAGGYWNTVSQADIRVLALDEWDCNLNGTLDFLEVIANPAVDGNDNGLLDVCEQGGDSNGDGTVDLLDLLNVLSVWGPCGDPCYADADGDGVVGWTDLLIVLGNWGL